MNTPSLVFFKFNQYFLVKYEHKTGEHLSVINAGAPGWLISRADQFVGFKIRTAKPHTSILSIVSRCAKVTYMLSIIELL